MNSILHSCDRQDVIDVINAHRYLFFEMKLPVISLPEFATMLKNARRLLAPDAAALDWTRVEFTEKQKLIAISLLMDF